MPRFGTKSILVAFAVVALWLSTYSGFRASRDIRAIILLVAFLSSGLAALYYRGRRQAFWIGFFAVMLTIGLGFPKDYVPNYIWVHADWGQFAPVPTSFDNQQAFAFVLDVIKTLTALSLSLVVGCIGAAIYDVSRKTDDG